MTIIENPVYYYSDEIDCEETSRGFFCTRDLFIGDTRAKKGDIVEVRDNDSLPYSKAVFILFTDDYNVMAVTYGGKPKTWMYAKFDEVKS